MEKNKDIEKAAAFALLDRGIAFRIPAPAIMMLFGKKTIKISVKRLYLGTLIYLSSIEDIAPLETIAVSADHKQLISDMGTTARSIPIKTIIEQSVHVSRAVAACLLNSKIKIRLFGKLLGRYLRRTCTLDQLQELIMWLFVYGRTESFTITTELLERMRVTMMMNSGQD